MTRIIWLYSRKLIMSLCLYNVFAYCVDDQLGNKILDFPFQLVFFTILSQLRIQMAYEEVWLYWVYKKGFILRHRLLYDIQFSSVVEYLILELKEDAILEDYSRFLKGVSYQEELLGLSKHM